MNLNEKSTEAVGMMIYFDDADAMFPALSQAEKGDLFDALIAYGKTGEEYHGNNDKVFMTFRLMATKIRRDQQKLAEKKEKYRQNRMGRNGTIDNNGQQSLTIDKDCEGSAYNSNSISNSNCNSKIYKDNTRNVNRDRLTDEDDLDETPKDNVQQWIDEVVRHMNDCGFDYSSCEGKGGIRGLLAKYFRKDKRKLSEIIDAVDKTVDRLSAGRNNDDDVGYLIRCLK